MINQKEIMEAIADYLGITASDIDKHANLREDLNLGPIELNDLLSDLGNRFGVGFDGEEVIDLETVEDLIALVEDNSL